MFPFCDWAREDFYLLHYAASRLIETFVEKKGKKFTPTEAKRLSKGVLSCLNVVCQPGMADQIPREELEPVVPRILNVLARDTTRGAVNKAREEEKRNIEEESFHIEVVIPVRNAL